MRELMLGVAVTCLLGTAVAQDSDDGLKSIGVGVMARTQPYAAMDDDLQVNIIPSLHYERGRFWFRGKQAGLELTDPKSDGPWTISALVDYRFEGYEADDSPVFEGMADRDGTLEGGAEAIYDMGEIRLKALARADLLDTHSGFDLVGQAEYLWAPAQYTLIRPYAGLKYRSEDQAGYYFGVAEDEAMILTGGTDGLDTGFERVAYAPGDTLTPFVGISVRQAVSKHLAVTFYAQHDFLPTEITDSPLIDADEESQTRLGVFIVKPFLN